MLSSRVEIPDPVPLRRIELFHLTKEEKCCHNVRFYRTPTPVDIQLTMIYEWKIHFLPVTNYLEYANESGSTHGYLLS